VGEHSPFRRLRDLKGQVAFLGVPHAARCNTSCHGVEELLPTPPPYLFQEDKVTYTVKDWEGKIEVVEHTRHGFSKHGQRYERVLDYMPLDTHRSGRVGEAMLHVVEAQEMWDAALMALEKDSLCLVEEIVPGSEGHSLVMGSTGKPRYIVGPSSEDSVDGGGKRQKTCDISCPSL